MLQATCKLVGCDRPKYGHGWCLAHWNRWRRNGEPGPVEVRPHRAGPVVGEDNPCWRGDDVSYAAVHRRLSVYRGRAKDQLCSRCGSRANGWAYQHTAVDERICEKVGLPFTTDLSCYEPMCWSCHAQFDALNGWAHPERWGRGVCQVGRNGRWRAYATIAGKQHSGGTFATRNEATEAAGDLRRRLLVERWERLADLAAAP